MELIISGEIFQLPHLPDGISASQEIEPADKLDPLYRQSLESADFLNIVVFDAPPDLNEPSRGPEAFDHPTVAWACKMATFVVIWSCAMPFERDRFEDILKAHVRRGGRTMVVLTRPTHHADWAAHVSEWCRPGTEFLNLLSIDFTGGAQCPLPN